MSLTKSISPDAGRPLMNTPLCSPSERLVDYAILAGFALGAAALMVLAASSRSVLSIGLALPVVLLLFAFAHHAREHLRFGMPVCFDARKNILKLLSGIFGLSFTQADIFCAAEKCAKNIEDAYLLGELSASPQMTSDVAASISIGVNLDALEMRRPSAVTASISEVGDWKGRGLAVEDAALFAPLLTLRRRAGPFLPEMTGPTPLGELRGGRVLILHRETSPKSAHERARALRRRARDRAGA